MNWFLIAIALISCGWSFFLLSRMYKTEDKLRLSERTVEQLEEFIENSYIVKVAYMETESDIQQCPDKCKREKIIRHKLYNQIAQKISKNFNHKMDLERSESGHIIYSYKFLTKRL